MGLDMFVCSALKLRAIPQTLSCGRKRESQGGGRRTRGAGQIHPDSATEGLKQSLQDDRNLLSFWQAGTLRSRIVRPGSRPLVGHCLAWQRVIDGLGKAYLPPTLHRINHPASILVALRSSQFLSALQTDMQPPWPSAWSRGRRAISQHNPCRGISPSRPCEHCRLCCC